MAGFGLLSGGVGQWFLLWTVYGVATLSIEATVWDRGDLEHLHAQPETCGGLVLCGSALTQDIAPRALRAPDRRVRMATGLRLDLSGCSDACWRHL